jgi:hypothetical protein
MGCLRGDPVQLEYLEAPRLKILDCRRSDVEAAEVESLVRLGDGLDRAAEARCFQVRAIQEDCAAAMGAQLG